ncbi:NarL family two-component system sensor histidine kinase LiaS [Bacillus ectoiniformans]|uniref:sensor histidine kinase n=1 Tax=Bacillus ectoiniformans TaxID=1494429 RepID=UPI00195D5B1F|nr:sensor histidine kinase [Bacillus ectoiniformans]MBM7649440.1 NarL family two-component system sensor histidine kinase LiaS [Bacillus ectoiniformans]
MNLFTKQIVQIFIALFIVSGLIIYASVEAFSVSSWQDFMKEGPLDLPFALFVMVSVVSLAFICGLIYGGLQWSSMKKVERRLDSLIAGKEASETTNQLPPDYSAIEKKCIQLERAIGEQKQAARRLTSEKIENQEKLIQEMVSQERQRLARELHDSVSQQLFAASMLMSAVNESRPQDNPVETKQLAMVEEMIQQSQLEMRALLLHLRPVALKGKSLKEGIDELMRELSQKVPLAIHWTAEEIPMDRGMEDHLFRIVQESISNTLRHAKASRLDVLTIWRDGFVILRISDDGIGFDVEKNKLGSYGLQNMHERAIEIGGAMKIISLPANGTKLEVKVPLTLDHEGGLEK